MIGHDHCVRDWFASNYYSNSVGGSRSTVSNYSSVVVSIMRSIGNRLQYYSRVYLLLYLYVLIFLFFSPGFFKMLDLKTALLCRPASVAQFIYNSNTLKYNILCFLMYFVYYDYSTSQQVL